MTDSHLHSYDIIIIGAGVAGLWLAHRLQREGYNLVVIEKDALGGTQTLASQGMIHGGQKYALAGAVTGHAASAAAMPARWESCFGGYGDADLTGVKFLSPAQVMWAAGGMVADAAVFAAAQAVNAATRRLAPGEIPAALSGVRFAYELPEKVLDVKSLVAALARPLRGRVLRGTAEGLLPDGQVAVSGLALKAQMIVWTAGAGNEQAFDLLKIKARHTQRRPLRQVMVRPVPFALYGHGIVADPKPRATVTSHPLDGGDGYVWYLGGNIAEKGAGMDADAAIAFARAELAAMFPKTGWDGREWAAWAGDRAEPFDESGALPPGPHVHRRGQILVAWPTKLTFAPALADRVAEALRDAGVVPREKSAPPPLPPAETGLYPWESAAWKTP